MSFNANLYQLSAATCCLSIALGSATLNAAIAPIIQPTTSSSQRETIQLPAANPATVPVQKRSRKETECGNNAIPATSLNCDGS